MSNWTDDDWLTPPELLAAFGKFDTDPAVADNMPWRTATTMYTRADNGLLKPWLGRVWLNPPFSDMESWMRRMAACANGMSLVNTRTETVWFQDCIFKVAHAILFCRGRISFVRPDGQGRTNGKMGQAIVAYTETDAGILYRAGLEGQFVPLVLTFKVDLKITWRTYIRFLLRECGGTATLEQLYQMASGHPKAERNLNFKAKIRQQVQRVAKPVARSTWTTSELL